MTRTEYLERIREYLRDIKGQIWEDAELLRMLDRAAYAYSADTGSFRGTRPFRVDADGVFRVPADHIAVIAAWNGRHCRMEPASAGDARRAWGEYTAVEGDARFLYDTLSGFGTVRLCPNPWKKQDLKIFATASYGLPVTARYGVPSRGTGYGIPVRMYRFRHIGDMVYARSEDAERIADHAALICHVLFQAFSVDGEFQDADKAALYEQEYRRRVDRAAKTMTAPGMIRRTAAFF